MKKYKLDGVFQRAPEKTWPGRVYPKEMFQKELTKGKQIMTKWRSGNIDILTRAPKPFDSPAARGPLAPAILAVAAVVAIGAAVWSCFYGEESKPKHRKKKKS